MRNNLKLPLFAALAFGMIAVLATPALADSRCYDQEQFEADRGLRLHTDVEVIMLTCRYSTKAEDLRKLYLAFLKKNAPTIRKWEKVIAKAYAGTGRSSNEVIDNFRTSLANQKAGEAARLGPKPFCKQWADFVPYAVNLTPEQVREYVHEPDKARPTKRQPCG